MREFALPLFSAIIGSIFVEDWTRNMSQNFRALSIPKNLKVTIACMFLRGEPAVWFERVVQPHLYRWNKFRSSLETFWKLWRGLGKNNDYRVWELF